MSARISLWKLTDFEKSAGVKILTDKNGFESWTRRINERDKVEFDQMFAILTDKKETA